MTNDSRARTPMISNGADLRGLGPWRPESDKRRYWRWVEPDTSFGVSGSPNNKFRPMNELTNYVNGGALGTKGNNAGANDELFSFHPGGVNILTGTAACGSSRIPSTS